MATIITDAIKEISLRQAVREFGIRRPDERWYSFTADGTQRLQITGEMLDHLRALGGNPLEHVHTIEHPVDEVPPREWEDESWTVILKPDRTMWLLLMGSVPSSGDEFRVKCDSLYSYQLPEPDAPTVTGTAGANDWTYAITAYDDSGETDLGSQAVFASAADDDGALAVTPHTIAWTAVYGATGYRVWCVDAPGGVATTGLVGDTTALTLIHSAAAVDTALPSANTSETTVPEIARDPVAAFGGYLALDTVMGTSVPNTPDDTGGAPVDWEGVLDNAKKLKDVLYKEFMDFLARTEGEEKKPRSAVVFSAWRPESRHGDPALAVYRSPRRRGW